MILGIFDRNRPILIYSKLDVGWAVSVGIWGRYMACQDVDKACTEYGEGIPMD